MSTRVLAAVLLFAALPAARPAPAPKHLAIVNATVRQYEDGPPAAPGSSFFTGDTVFFSFQIDGYQVSPENKIDLMARIEAVDPEGTPLVKPLDHPIATQVSAEDKNWRPVVRDSVQLPPLAFSGKYEFRLTVEDRLSKQTAKAEVVFAVQGRAVEPSATLVARNFRFLRSEDAQQAMQEAESYRPGDSVWAKFEITGFRYGENNKVQVTYGLTVLGPSGNTMFTQPEAATEQEESFYPKKYIPGALSLNLQKTIKPGEYTIVLTIRDAIGDQTDESRHAFRVE